MDRFLKPDKFLKDPLLPLASQEWNYWLKTLLQLLTMLSKLKVLIKHLSHIVYQLVAEKETYVAAIENVNEIYARRKLAYRKQSHLKNRSINSIKLYSF